MSLCVFDEQQGGTTLHQAAHQAAEALSMQPCGKHESPGSAVAVWQLEASIEQTQVGENKNRDKQKSSLKVLKAKLSSNCEGRQQTAKNDFCGILCKLITCFFSCKKILGF